MNKFAVTVNQDDTLTIYVTLFQANEYDPSYDPDYEELARYTRDEARLLMVALWEALARNAGDAES